MSSFIPNRGAVDCRFLTIDRRRSGDGPLLTRRALEMGKMTSLMDQTGHRVLLVDDNADSSEPLSLLLQTKGHETRISTDGEEAISVADQFLPTCVVLDLGLPRMDGYEVARRLRARPYGAGLVLVALTGWTGKDVRFKAAEAGFDYHLVKPVNWEELEQIVGSGQRQSAI